MLHDLRWTARPETGLVISILIAEDLVMAVYLSLLTGALAGSSVLAAVLTGITAAFLSKGMNARLAAAAAATAQGRAAFLASKSRGLVASDVIEALPSALARD